MKSATFFLNFQFSVDFFAGYCYRGWCKSPLVPPRPTLSSHPPPARQHSVPRPDKVPQHRLLIMAGPGGELQLYARARTTSAPPPSMQGFHASPTEYTADTIFPPVCMYLGRSYRMWNSFTSHPFMYYHTYLLSSIHTPAPVVQ